VPAGSVFTMKTETVRIFEMSSVELTSARCPSTGSNTVVTLLLISISCGATGILNSILNWL
jgi:hypothetical protein